MEHLFTYDAHIADAPRIAHKLMIAKNLAKRLSENNYLENATIDYDKIYRDKSIATLENIPGGGGRFVWTEDKHQLDMFHRASKHSNNMRKQDREMLFELVKKNIEKWWDQKRGDTYLEDKLLELKESFCKWYCPNKDKTIDLSCSGEPYCHKCDSTIICEEFVDVEINLCNSCPIDEYIFHIRDEL